MDHQDSFGNPSENIVMQRVNEVNESQNENRQELRDSSETNERYIGQ